MRTTISVSVLVWAWILGVGAAHSAQEEYAGDLRSSLPAVRRQTAVRLGRIGDRSAVPALVEALKDPETGVRREAAKALGAIKDARAVAALVEALGDRDTNVRLYAAYALGEIKDPKAAEALLRALRDPEWCVRDQAAWALREIGDPKIVGPLAAALEDQKADVAHVVWLLRHVGGAQTVKQLAALLKAPEVAVRMRAVHVLRELQNAEAVPPLVAALEDRDPNVRRSAVEALQKARDDRAKKPLEALVAREDDPAVLEAAQEALFQMSCEKDLVAYWPLDDRSTSIAKDATGHGNDGEIRGCTPVEGKVGHALRFGQGKYVELGQPAGLPIAERPLTIMAWVKSDAPSGVVVARGGAFCGFSLYVMDGVAKFGIHREQEGPAYIAAGGEKVVGPWVHLAGVVRSDRVELYVNGKLATTAKTPGYIPGNCGQGMEIGFDTANSPAEITDSFRGIIDEVKVYQAALSEEEINEQGRAEGRMTKYPMTKE
jgi:HEAT repeat protein